jgi:hypothetical protein
MRNSGHRRTKVVEDQVGALIDGIAHRLPGEQFVRNAAPTRKAMRAGACAARGGGLGHRLRTAAAAESSAAGPSPDDSAARQPVTPYCHPGLH